MRDVKKPTDGRSVNLELGEFTWEALLAESERQGVSVQELAAFAVLYYLADVDSGRISRQIRRSPSAGAPARSAGEPDVEV
jgi:hypothetical protein